MKRFIFLTLLIPSISNAEVPTEPNNDVIETWACHATFSLDQLVLPTKEVLVTAYIDKGRETGKLKVAGVTHDAEFSIEGFDRSWYFGLNTDGLYDYRFIIEPNGWGAYYDFSDAKKGEKVSPSSTMLCRAVVETKPESITKVETGSKTDPEVETDVEDDEY